MSANPLRRPSEPQYFGADEGRMLDFCLEHNRRCRAMSWPRWYYVQPAVNEKPAEIRTLDGIEAEEVWTVLDRRPIDYAGWERARLEKIERRCVWLIKQGGVTR